MQITTWLAYAWCLGSALVLSLGHELTETALVLGLLALGSLLAVGLRHGLGTKHAFTALVLGGLLPCAGLWATESLALALGFMGLLLSLGGVFLLLPARQAVPPSEHLLRLARYSMLIALWLKYNILSRYSQKVLGMLWIVLLPLSTSLILALVFGEILRSPMMIGVPFVAFFMAAVTPWSVFSQGIYGATTAVLAQMALISAVPIPREVPVIRVLGESLVDGFFMFACMLVINATLGILPGRAFLALPLIILTQIFGMLGLMFYISAASVLIRDIPQLVSVAMQLLFYLTPIVYSAQIVPPHLQIILTLNPLFFITDAYRSIILHNEIPNLRLMYGAFVAALALLYSGYLFFKSHDQRFADYA